MLLYHRGTVQLKYYYNSVQTVVTVLLKYSRSTDAGMLEVLKLKVLVPYM